MDCKQEEPLLVGRCPAIRAALNLVARVAPTRATVLITGETGTGKELIARLLHGNSDRANRPLLAVNCGAVAESLVESELFGHARGSFTGANTRRAGKFAAADGGTLFFDEVTSMSERLQAALLRVLQSGEYCPIGSDCSLMCDVRVVAAANRELRDLVEEGTFRADLFYRLNIIRIHLPPLRQRPADLPLLIDHYLQMYAHRYGRGELAVEPASLRELLDYDYPGNVRELDTIIHRATLLSEGPLVSVSGLLESHVKLGSDAVPARIDADNSSFHVAKAQVVERFERDYLTTALRRSRGVITEAAKATGLSERNFHLKLRKYGLGHETPADASMPAG